MTEAASCSCPLREHNSHGGHREGQCLRLRNAQAGHMAALLVHAPDVPLGHILQNTGLFSLLTVKLWKAELTANHG